MTNNRNTRIFPITNFSNKSHTFLICFCNPHSLLNYNFFVSKRIFLFKKIQNCRPCTFTRKDSKLSQSLVVFILFSVSLSLMWGHVPTLLYENHIIIYVSILELFPPCNQLTHFYQYYIFGLYWSMLLSNDWNNLPNNWKYSW